MRGGLAPSGFPCGERGVCTFYDFDGSAREDYGMLRAAFGSDQESDLERPRLWHGTCYGVLAGVLDAPNLVEALGFVQFLSSRRYL